LDIVGLNYSENCYEPHHTYAPKRIMVGSETYPHGMAKRWKQVVENSYLIGDFMWTALDYLGEAGIGVPIYGTTKGGFNRPYPCVTGGCAAIDLLGNVETEGYAAAIAWGVYRKPVIAVHPVNHSGEKHFFGMWRDTDAVPSWSWKDCEGRKAEIDVYSIGDSVELFQDGVSLGRKALKENMASFKTIYRPGMLRAISYDNHGKVIAEEILQTAGKESKLQVLAEASSLKADGEDLSFVSVSLTDTRGIVKLLEDRSIKVSVSGAARLAAIGSANPVTEERYTGDRFMTWNGRMGFYVQSTGGAGTADIEVSSPGLEPVQLSIPVIRINQ
jgi:beta-galactosidase